jgi:hypothetical protein
MRSALIAVTAVLMLAPSASAECAWVLWTHGSIIGTHPTELAMDQPWRPVEGWSTRTECAADQAVRVKRDEQLRETPEWKRQWKDLMREYADKAKPEVEYLCLPDTVDPRGPRGTER